MKPLDVFNKIKDDHMPEVNVGIYSHCKCAKLLVQIFGYEDAEVRELEEGYSFLYGSTSKLDIHLDEKPKCSGVSVKFDELSEEDLALFFLDVASYFNSDDVYVKLYLWDKTPEEAVDVASRLIDNGETVRSNLGQAVSGGKFMSVGNHLVIFFGESNE